MTLVKTDTAHIDANFYSPINASQREIIEGALNQLTSDFPDMTYSCLTGALFVNCDFKSSPEVEESVMNILFEAEVRCEIHTRRLRGIDDARS
jgi:hypothetical protein